VKTAADLRNQMEELVMKSIKAIDKEELKKRRKKKVKEK